MASEDGEPRTGLPATHGVGEPEPCSGTLVLVHRCASTHTPERGSGWARPNDGAYAHRSRLFAPGACAQLVGRRPTRRPRVALPPYGHPHRCTPQMLQLLEHILDPSRPARPERVSRDEPLCHTGVARVDERDLRGVAIKSVEAAPDRPTTFVAPIVVIHLNL